MLHAVVAFWRKLTRRRAAVLAPPLAALALCGCSVLQKDVAPMTVDVAVPTPPPGGGTLSSQVVANLQFAATRRGAYVTAYNNLAAYQRVRDGAILASSIGLSATTVFRGGVNDLKWAGFLVGLSNFYDKAVPLSARITAAQSAFLNFNTLIQVGNSVLVNPLDDDKKSLNDTIDQLTADLQVANTLIPTGPTKATPCPSVAKAAQASLARRADNVKAAAVACTQQQLDEQASITRLQAAVTAGQTTLANGQAARTALLNIPADITAATDAIDKSAWMGIVVTLDQTTLTQGFTAASVPKPAAAPPASGTVKALAVTGPTPDDVASRLITETAALQDILNRVDYVGLDARIKASAPTLAPAPPATPTKPTGG